MEKLKIQSKIINPMIRGSLFILTLLVLQDSIVIAQQNNEIHSLDSFHIQKLVIRNDLDKSQKGNKDFFYFAFNYDYGDSISIYIKDKSVYNGKLVYREVDSNSTLFPYNRMLLRFSKKYLNCRKSNCRIIFWHSRKIINLNLLRKIEYFSFGIQKNSDEWHLTLLNTYPWTD